MNIFLSNFGLFFCFHFVKQRMNFGFAHRLHLYSDYSILVSDFLSHGTLQVFSPIFDFIISLDQLDWSKYFTIMDTFQDAINSYVVVSSSMEEVLCIYYTIEMLYMLETLHDAAIIHGDFKPDNLLIRYSR